jgi:hypothetical protein
VYVCVRVGDGGYGWFRQTHWASIVLHLCRLASLIASPPRKSAPVCWSVTRFSEFAA